MWKNTVEPDRQQMAIWCKHIACWIPKAIYTSSDIYNTSCFSTETTVTRMLIRILPVLFYQNCRSCLSLHVRSLPHIGFPVDHYNNKIPRSSQITDCGTLSAVTLSDLELRAIQRNSAIQNVLYKVRQNAGCYCISHFQ